MNETQMNFIKKLFNFLFRLTHEHEVSQLPKVSSNTPMPKVKPPAPKRAGNHVKSVISYRNSSSYDSGSSYSSDSSSSSFDSGGF